MPTIFSHDDMVSLGTQLLNAAILNYQAAMAAHATTVGEPAPLPLHPIVQTILQGDGTFTVATPDQSSIGAQLQPLEQAMQARVRVATLESQLNLTANAGLPIAQRIAAIKTAIAALT